MRAFGRVLEQWRLGAGLTAPQVSRILKSRHEIRLDSSTLYNYESGTVFAPDPGVLWALSDLYRVDIESILELLLANRRNPSAETLSPPPPPQRIAVSGDEMRWIEGFRALSAPKQAQAWKWFREFFGAEADASHPPSQASGQ